MTSKEKSRTYAVEEIYTTEESYVKQLKECERVYFTKLKDEPEFKELIGKIHQSFTYVLNVNEKLFDTMKQKHDDNKFQNELGSCISQLLPFLKMYKDFVAISEDVFQDLLVLERKESTSKKLLELMSEIETKPQLDFRSYLIMPVQRIPRYKLLLNEVLKHTEPDHPDFNKLQECLSKIDVVAKDVNSAIAEMERNFKMSDAKNRIKGKIPIEGDLIIVSRHYVKEGMIMKVCRKSNEERYFYLFNDLILYGKGDEKSMTVSEALYLEETEIKDLPKDDDGFKFSFISPNKSFKVVFETEEKKMEWFNIITKTIDELKQKNIISNKISSTKEMAPVWDEDDSVKACVVCDDKFTVVNRRHHCRKCGKVICGSCSEYKLKINDKKERVCILCFVASSPEKDEVEKANKKLQKMKEKKIGIPKKARNLPQLAEVAKEFQKSNVLKSPKVSELNKSSSKEELNKQPTTPKTPKNEKENETSNNNNNNNDNNNDNNTTTNNSDNKNDNKTKSDNKTQSSMKSLSEESSTSSHSSKLSQFKVAGKPQSCQVSFMGQHRSRQSVINKTTNETK